MIRMLFSLAIFFSITGIQAKTEPAKPLDMAGVLAASTPADWRPLNLENTLVMTLPKGQVIIELAPDFAPNHVANIKKLVREKYFDGLAFMRAQENYVVQFGDADGKRDIKTATKNLPAEFARKIDKKLPFAKLPDGDVYAPQVGFTNGFPVARDPKKNLTWITHCYATVGAGRDMAADSGGGTELYVVIGHSPRHLDRNVTLVGRVIQGMDLLSTLPRGTEALGFYKTAEERAPINSIQVAADMSTPPKLELLRTDTATFTKLVQARRFRREEWFLEPTGHVELCNVPLPVRKVQ
jgi:cyclophilin family peptidyl-prolyl cis-trans isomerase